MSDLAAKRGAVPAAKKALFLVFHIGDERFALRATEVAEVLPRLPLKPIAHAPLWVAGIFAHRGALVPVIDLSALTFGQPAQARTSTRLVLVNYQPEPWVAARWLGLILEQATDTLRCDLSEFKPYGLDNREAPYLGLVREDAAGLMQWIGVNELLTEPVRALLFSAELSV
ncbi:chemotaxis protein CheW [Pseudomonas sp. 13B_2.1_Bac1]|jgi:chemotaxis-related protein WspB|uniref:chemotaxis protein CheW n=1 Tax=unclassified Pseudomonas TaxID=196821 RepID=UPI000EA013A1|nr:MULTISPECIES: chemotaxis protein CheW [unclassified Pseudomonas]AYF47197.1 chemotaxis protein CheW [Pseudomonas fluorescens]MBK5475553.1 purine-binding chemotaxis protein CheW [Pseudomonas sp. TH21]MBS7844291.1 purine-binding chemotaxis protein CheW [Pseudomonas fluorescens]MCU1784736.1 chemotaxis protein CheW [Pseudomonas sp. 13B_2.1_Bac1]QTV18731.1 purine-binding chemotaxis protein CheW [Pseudomonas fluorescens]